MCNLRRALAGIALIVVLGQAPVLAKPGSAETAVPDRPWYPPGYRDFRIAGAAMLDVFPRDPFFYDAKTFASEDAYYDVIDCSLGYDLPEKDWRTRQYQELALDIARMRIEMHKMGYRSAVYDQPLLTYEKAQLERLATAKEPPPVVPYDENAPIDDSAAGLESPAEPGSAAESAEDETVSGWDWSGLQTLADAMEANRARLQPGKPRIVSDGGCGGAEDEFTIAMSPANGRLWLVNAFAFKVCERKVRDPWDHRACGWTEYGAGDSAVASGRYMYEARWPDGTVRRGARIFAPDPDSEEQSVVFRRK